MLEQILKILEKESRTTVDQIAAMTGGTVRDVTKIIKQAEKEKVILKYKTIINWGKVRDEEVRALIEVKVAPQKDVGFETTAHHIYLFPQVQTVYLLSGTYDLLVIVTGKSMQEISAFVSQKLAPTEGVQGTVTHFLLKRYKEDGEILIDEKEEKRQPMVL